MKMQALQQFLDHTGIEADDPMKRYYSDVGLATSNLKDNHNERERNA